MSKSQNDNRNVEVNENENTTEEQATVAKSQPAGTKYYRFRSNVNLNSAYFEKNHVYPLPEAVAKQISPEALQEVSVEDVDATQRRVQEEQARLDELNRAGQRRPLVIEDGRMAEAALNPIVGRPVVRYPEETVRADEAGRVQEEEGTETPKGRDFRNTIAKK